MTSSSTAHERIATLERRCERLIELFATNTDLMAMWIDKMKILAARINDLEARIDDRSYTNNQHTNDRDDAESRRLARELLAEARAFGKPN